jgi:hypothetical protein
MYNKTSRERAPKLPQMGEDYSFRTLGRMVSPGHSPGPPNEAPLKTSPENTNKSEVTTWTGQLLKIEQT